MRCLVTFLVLVGVGCGDSTEGSTTADSADTSVDTNATSTSGPATDPSEDGSSTSSAEGDGSSSGGGGSTSTGGTTMVGGSEGSGSSSTGGSSTGGSSTGTTGEVSLECGDGIVGDDEECDDGDEDDENLCANDCTFNAMIVFVSSTLQTGNMGGLDGADGICQDLAEDAGLAGTYAAWLGTGKESPSDRLTHSDLPYVLVDGTIVADSWDDLTDSSDLDHAIDLDENGDPPNGGGMTCDSQVLTAQAVFSNSYYYGSSFGDGESCSGWTSNAGSARFGMTGPENPFWSTCGIAGCGGSALLYCFEQ